MEDSAKYATPSSVPSTVPQKADLPWMELEVPGSHNVAALKVLGWFLLLSFPLMFLIATLSGLFNEPEKLKAAQIAVLTGGAFVLSLLCIPPARGLRRAWSEMRRASRGVLMKQAATGGGPLYFLGGVLGSGVTGPGTCWFERGALVIPVFMRPSLAPGFMLPFALVALATVVWIAVGRPIPFAAVLGYTLIASTVASYLFLLLFTRQRPLKIEPANLKSVWTKYREVELTLRRPVGWGWYENISSFHFIVAEQACPTFFSSFADVFPNTLPTEYAEVARRIAQGKEVNTGSRGPTVDRSRGGDLGSDT
jgi:hypothetical protein